MSANVSEVFVGREAETALLSEKLGAAIEGDGQVVLVSGEPIFEADQFSTFHALAEYLVKMSGADDLHID